MRIFIGIGLNIHTKESLYELQNKWLQTAIKKRPVKFDNFHLTLKFIGEATEKETEEIYEALMLELTSIKAFSIKIADVGFFIRNEKFTIWAGVTEGRNELKSLHKLINKALGSTSIIVKKQRFVPHITLAREVVFDKKDNNLPLLNEVELIDVVTIFKSHFVGDALTYTPIYEIPLIKE